MPHYSYMCKICHLLGTFITVHALSRALNSEGHWYQGDLQFTDKEIEIQETQLAIHSKLQMVLGSERVWTCNQFFSGFPEFSTGMCLGLGDMQQSWLRSLQTRMAFRQGQNCQGRGTSVVAVAAGISFFFPLFEGF